MRIIISVLIVSILGLLSSCKQDKSGGQQAQPQKTTYKPSDGNAPKANIPQNPLKTGGLQWLTFEDVANNKSSSSKKYLIDIYTEWCGWCKVMDKKTFTDPELQQYLNENFNVVKFDAEQKTSVPFNGKKYEYQGSGRRGINQLAIELLGSRQSYPTMVYLDENLNIIKASPGYKKPQQLLTELMVINKS